MHCLDEPKGSSTPQNSTRDRTTLTVNEHRRRPVEMWPRLVGHAGLAAGATFRPATFLFRPDAAAEAQLRQGLALVNWGIYLTRSLPGRNRKHSEKKGS